MPRDVSTRENSRRPGVELRRHLKATTDAVRDWLPVRVVAVFNQSQASNYAGALAFSLLMSMFPLILGMLAIIGLVAADPAREAQFQQALVSTFPRASQGDLVSAMHGVKQSAGWLGLLSLAGLAWGATAIFSTMEFALTQIFGTRQRDAVRQRLMGLLMMGVLVVALVAGVGLNVVVAMTPAAWLIGLVLGAAVIILLLVAIYRFVPNRTFTVKEVLPGAILAGTLVEALTFAFPFYARLSGGFATYGAQFGLVLMLATWFYLLSSLLLLGAVFNRMRLPEPVRLGIVASPMHETRAVRRPIQAIQEHKQQSLHGDRRRKPAAS